MTEQDLADFIRNQHWGDSKGHLWILYALAKGFSERLGPVRALEIGMRGGNTTIALLAGLTNGNHDSRLVTVDNESDPNGPICYVEAKESVKKYGFEPKWEYHLADSHSWDSPYKDYQLIFIDGDHPGALDDFNQFSPLLLQDGLMIFHDAEYEPVRIAMLEIEKRGDWQMTVIPFCYGLGLLRRKSDWKNGRAFPIQ